MAGEEVHVVGAVWGKMDQLFPDNCFGFCTGTQSHRRSHWSYPQSVLGGEEEGFCEKRLG